MNQHLLDACESVDAAVFSGDVIWDDNSRTQLKGYVERWQRAIAEHERTEADAAEQAASGNDAFSEAVKAFDLDPADVLVSQPSAFTGDFGKTNPGPVILLHTPTGLSAHHKDRATAFQMLAEAVAASGRAVVSKPGKELLDLALANGAVLTGTPDGREPITVVFSIDAWRKFDGVLLYGGTKKPLKSGIGQMLDDAVNRVADNSLPLEGRPNAYDKIGLWFNNVVPYDHTMSREQVRDSIANWIERNINMQEFWTPQVVELIRSLQFNSEAPYNVGKENANDTAG